MKSTTCWTKGALIS